MVLVKGTLASSIRRPASAGCPRSTAVANDLLNDGVWRRKPPARYVHEKQPRQLARVADGLLSSGSPRPVHPAQAE
jgi:hypothetical protein